MASVEDESNEGTCPSCGRATDDHEPWCEDHDSLAGETIYRAGGSTPIIRTLTRRAREAEAKLARVEKLRDEWLTDQVDWQGRPRSWWDEKPYGEELAAVLADAPAEATR
jgi:hypothetical protein